ncbi:MAG TPA: hypothetical protein VGH87_09290, partial [Polyangiaceae bacterium]
MTRTSPLAALALAFVACNDSAEVLTPDTGTPEAGADVQTSDVTTQPDASDATTIDAPSDVVDATPDVAPTCEAGLEICNNVCTDPSTYQTDDKNCGFCGHDCQGNTCTAGMCAPDTIGSTLPTPSYLAVDGTNVYVTTAGDVYSTTSGEVYQCPVAGCPTKLGPMTSGLNNPNGITLDSSKVYWVNSGDLGSPDGSVMSCPLSDCGKNNSTRVKIAKNIQFVQGITLDATNVYFGVWGANPFLDGHIDACPLAGCPGTPTAMITGQYKPLFVALDGSNIFMAAPGGSAAIAYLESGPIPGPTTGTRIWSGSIQNHIAGFSLFAQQLYFTDDFKGEIAACPETTCTAPVTLATSLSNPEAIAVDAKGIYWIDDNGIETCPITGCTTPTLLATVASTKYAIDLAINGSYV